MQSWNILEAWPHVDEMALMAKGKGKTPVDFLLDQRTETITKPLATWQKFKLEILVEIGRTLGLNFYDSSKDASGNLAFE
jgi:carbonic anhydrase